ncbi:MAG TPA: non-ribosomal peptide synthetase, partial [Chitinophagaceae bacterium]|nr:non-ribosomal peptide synthetase [Chitinophagaceae bacterium]
WPAQPVGSLSMLSAGERHQLLQFSGTRLAYPNTTVIDLFEEQVRKTPGATAVIHSQEAITYQQLNERANQLSRCLAKLGVKNEQLVAVCLDRSIEMLVAVIGILKVGAAYVPIDTTYPSERITYMLRDARSTIVISSSACAASQSMPKDIQVINIDNEHELFAKEPATDPGVLIKPSQLAYVMYTSGSTGKPKGVMIEHKNLVNYLLNARTCYITDDPGTSGNFLHLSYSFDAAITGLFMPLLHGKSVVMAADNSVDIFTEENFLKYAPYDFIKLTPSHLELLRPVIKPGKPLAKYIVAGGEALQWSQVEYLLQAGDYEIVNEYGPTEATVGCTTYFFNRSITAGSIKNNISIGKPIDNASIYILDALLQPVPVGVPGELYIGGAGVARGYWNKAELTAERFIADPFSDEPGARMYRSGDLARWLSNGDIEYLGRADEQVKIRGYRIEPGEIESVLHQSSFVKQAVVMAREFAGSTQLVAYVVPQAPFEQDALRLYLQHQLPGHMVPAVVVAIESMPLTSNGKIDRNQLPDPSVTGLLKDEYVAPRDHIEEVLARIWQELLEVERVGINDDFFDQGGHSLLAIRVISSIRRQLEVELPIADLFDHSTIASLAQHLQQTGKGMLLPPVKAGSRPE